MKSLCKFKILTLVTAATAVFSISAQAETLRLLTWGGYAPQNVVEQFE